MKKIVSLPVVAILATFLVATQSQKSEAATIIHDYTLNNTFTDTLGGPALVGNGGTLTSTGYVFAPNQGLSLSLPNSVNTSNYSILIDFNIVNIGYYRKLVDFKELTSDSGFYSYEGRLNFYISAFDTATTGQEIVLHPTLWAMSMVFSSSPSLI
jgi:hypothetical protein